mgnify:CR=1 FL=1
MACSHQVTTGLGVHGVNAFAAGLPTAAWHRLSTARGAKGHRWYDRSFTAPPAADGHRGHHWPLIRRNRRTGELAFYRCWAPADRLQARWERIPRPWGDNTSY